MKKFISNLFLKNSTNPDQMLRRFQNKSACLFFSPSLMTRGSIIYSSWPESSSLMRWVAWPGTGEGGIKAPAPVEWLAVWGLDAHHHGAAAQLSGGCDALDNTQRSFHQDYQNIRQQKKEYQQPWEKPVRKCWLEILSVCKTYQSVTMDPSRWAKPRNYNLLWWRISVRWTINHIW